MSVQPSKLWYVENITFGCTVKTLSKLKEQMKIKKIDMQKDNRELIVCKILI